MNEDANRQTIAELRRIRFALYFLLGLLIVGFLPAFVKGFSRGFSEASSEGAPSWDRVRTAVNHQDFKAALSMANTLVERQPSYYYGQAYLAGIYLTIGDLTNAESHYLRAYELFPNEEAEKDLVAARKRLAGQQPLKLLSK